ncbi:MAG TPA: hypothetical protein VGF29_17230 [Hyphomicrobiaceae bacterium]|jgi:hypothetical protein
MDLSTLFLGTAMTVLLLAGAGLGTAMVLLERPGAQPVPAAGMARRRANGRARSRRTRSWSSRRRKN